MVAYEYVFNGVQYGKFNEYIKLSKSLSKHIKENLNDVIFFCIGTDRITGDSFAPFIGTMLKEKGYENVMGCIDHPIHAINLDDKIKEIPNGKTVIAFDTSLGKSRNIGKIVFNKGKLYPGKGVDKNLTPIGDYSVYGIVNVSGFMEIEVLQATRLSVVLSIAKEVVKAIEIAFPLENKINMSYCGDIII